MKSIINFLNKKQNHGQTLLTVVMWATGISVTIGGLIYNSASSRFSKFQDELSENKVEVTTIQAKLPDLDRRLQAIEQKQDVLGNDIKEILKAVK